MARRDANPDFIEALARGLDVIRVFQPRQPAMSLAAVAAASGLARPTARRILLTLRQMGYVRAADGGFELTPRVLELGMAYVLSRNLWEIARPHMERLVSRTRESSSVAQLDGSDIVYVARVAVPKIVALAVTIGTRFPAAATSLGKVLLAGLPPGAAERVLAEPSRSGITPWLQASAQQRSDVLREVALNVCAHAAETPMDVLTGEYLPLLLQTAGAISADWAACHAAPYLDITAAEPARPGPAEHPQDGRASGIRTGGVLRA